MFWFMIFNSFDATYLYQYTFILLYNLAFTSLPVIALGGEKPSLLCYYSWLICGGSIRSGSQCQGSARVPSIVHPWYSRARVHEIQVLDVHARRALPVCSRVLHPVLHLDPRPCHLLEREDARVSRRLRYYGVCRCYHLREHLRWHEYSLVRVLLLHVLTRY